MFIVKNFKNIKKQFNRTGLPFCDLVSSLLCSIWSLYTSSDKKFITKLVIDVVEHKIIR